MSEGGSWFAFAVSVLGGPALLVLGVFLLLIGHAEWGVRLVILGLWLLGLLLAPPVAGTVGVMYLLHLLATGAWSEVGRLALGLLLAAVAAVCIGLVDNARMERKGR